MANGTRDVNNVMPGSDGLRILGDFWKMQLVEIWSWAERVEIRIWARPGELGQRDAPRVVGSDGTVSIVKILSLSLSLYLSLSLSPRVEKPKS